MEKKLLTIFGASGLVGSSILREALDRGYHVNGTLRDIEKQDRITRLKSLPSGNNAKFFQADMAEISSLDHPLINSDAAIICCLIPTYKGFDGTPAKELDDERGYNEITKPTVDGCLNILKSAKINNVKNILICSSTSSTNPIPPVSIKNELDHWSDEKEQCNSKKYTSAAKTYMEKAAFKFCAENNIRLSIFLPTGLYGPAVLPEHLKHNPFLWIKSVLEGGAPRHQKVPNDSASLIHLQDLARLFLAAYEDSSASGRYFGVLESFHWNDIYKECQKLIPDMLMPEPILEDPVAPTQFDFKRRDSLGVQIRDFPTIMRETVEWLKSTPFKEN